MSCYFDIFYVIVLALSFIKIISCDFTINFNEAWRSTNPVIRRKSVIVSPFGAIAPLATFSFAAESKQTRQEILKALKVTSISKLKKYYTEMTEELNYLNQIEINVDNKIIVSPKVQVNVTFNATVDRLLDVQIWIGNFRDAKFIKRINQLVRDVTRNNSKQDVINASDDLRRLNLCLINTVFVRTEWRFPLMYNGKRKFNKEGMKAMSHPYMKVTAKLYYFNEKTIKAELVSLPLMDARCSFVFVLPHKGSTKKSLELLKDVKIFNASAHMSLAYITLYVPKFTIDTKVDLQTVYDKMAIRSYKSPGETLFKMMSYDKKKISMNMLLLQKNFIDVNERGINIEIGDYGKNNKEAVNEKYKPMILDINRPFRFYLGCFETVILSGIVQEPQL